jgi:hypothetical protein
MRQRLRAAPDRSLRIIAISSATIASISLFLMFTAGSHAGVALSAFLVATSAAYAGLSVTTVGLRRKLSQHDAKPPAVPGDRFIGGEHEQHE